MPDRKSGMATPQTALSGPVIAAILSTKVFHPGPGLYPVRLVLIEMAAAAVVAGILGVIVGVPALRLRGIFLALATIAFVQILGVVALNLDITGGAIGIFGIPQPFGSQLQYMWLAILLMLLSMLFIARLERTRTGRALIALREDELAAAAMGVDPTYHKVLAFTASAVLAGAVGAISAHFINTWNSRQGTFDTSVNLMAFVLVGGSRTFVGPVVGGLVLTALPEALRGVADVGGLPPWLAQFLRDGRPIIFGVLIAIGTVFFPHGLITPGLLGRLGLGRRTGKV